VTKALNVWPKGDPDEQAEYEAHMEQVVAELLGTIIRDDLDGRQWERSTPFEMIQKSLDYMNEEAGVKKTVTADDLHRSAAEKGYKLVLMEADDPLLKGK